MLSAIVSGALRYRVVVLCGACVLVWVGWRGLRDAPMDVFPEFAPPLAEVQTEAPGLSTEEVDALVTVPVESALNGLPWLKTVRSKSVAGLSSVVLIFEEGTELMASRVGIQERLAQARVRLPAVAKAPVLLPPHSSLSRVMKLGMTSRVMTQVEMSELAVWTVRPRLMAVPGVANVAIWGQRDEEYQVLVDPERLRASGVTLDQVVRAAGDAAVVTAGGFVETPNQRLPVRMTPPVRSAEDLRAAVIEVPGGGRLRLGDVAEVVTGHAPPIGDAIINDEPGLLLIVEKVPWGNTLEVTRGVEAALDALQAGMPGVEVDRRIFRPATFIEESLANLTQALWVGCGLVVVVLVCFLFDWRTAVISLTAIPLSLLAAVLVLRWQGQTINTMVLAGLVIALGEVVDDAVIDVENVLRRLRENALAGVRRRPVLPVILEASLEVRSAVVVATLVVVLVTLPVFFLEGLAGSFFRPLVLAYVLSVLCSLVVALTVTPALSLVLLRGRTLERREHWLPRWLKGIYERVLGVVVGVPRVAMGLVVVSLAGAGWLARGLGEEFLPEFKERDFLMHWVEKTGTSLEAMTRITQRASVELRGVEGVKHFGSHIGRAEFGDEVVGANFTELWISLDRGVDYETSVQRINGIVEGYPGLYRDVQTYLRERVKEVLTGAGASIVVRIFGSDLEGLRAQAEAASAVMREIPGVTGLKVEQQNPVPHLRIDLRPAEMAAAGVSSGAVRRAVSTYVQGTRAGEVFEDQKIHRVVVWGAAETRADGASVGALLIDVPGGGHVRLGDVATVAVSPTPNEIRREGASRRIDVTCNVAGRDLGSVAEEVQRRVKGLTFAEGSHVEFPGEYAAREEARERLMWLGLAALAGVVVVLQADFQNARVTLLAVLSLPFALIGGVVAVWWSGGVLSMGGLIGFVTVLGIAARNGIMLLSHYQHLREVEGMAFGEELVRRGARERLVPILMTALCAGLAVVPLALRGNEPGHEIEHPMAVVILGGLVTSTGMSLLLMPALYGWLGRRAVVAGEGD